MARLIFRQEAMDSMASPDRLDQPLGLVRPADWILLASAGAIVLFALVWAIVAKVPVEIETRGILVGADGLSEVSGQGEGRLEALLVRSGQRVEAGQVIARLSRRNRARDIASAEAALSDAIAQASASESAYRAGEAGLSGAESAKIASLARRTAEVRKLLATREQTVLNMRGLIEQNAATEEELASVVASRDQLRAELRRLEVDRLDIGVGAAQRGNARGAARLGESQLVAQRRRELAQLRAQTDDEVLLRAPYAGEVVEIRANPGDVLAPGEAVATIASRTSARPGDSFEALLFATPGTGKRIAPGMKVEVVPTTTERAVYGHIEGEVVSTGSFPVSREAMVRKLRNDRLADELSAAGAPIEVRVRLKRTRGNASGFAWSSSAGPGFAITRGTMLDATVILERRAFIAVLFPGLAGP